MQLRLDLWQADVENSCKPVSLKLFVLIQYILCTQSVNYSTKFIAIYCVVIQTVSLLLSIPKDVTEYHHFINNILCVLKVSHCREGLGTICVSDLRQTEGNVILHIVFAIKQDQASWLILLRDA